MSPARPRPQPVPDTAERYVLNLRTAATPEALRVSADRDDLKGFTFFVSRSFEGGRERFRLHLGYFTTLAEAQQWLPVLRDTYPAAWAARAPAREAPVVPRAAPRVQDIAPAVPTLRPTGGPWSHPGLARPFSGDLIPSLPPAPSPPVLAAYPRQPRSGRPVSETGVLRILADRPAPQAPAREPQCFAVQLTRAAAPLDIDDVPPIPVLDQHTLYAVEGLRDGEPWYALRVGFFTDVASAKQLAREIRDEFAEVAVVPVSREEQQAASGGPEPAPAPVAALGEDTARTSRTLAIELAGDAGESPEDLLDDSGEYAFNFLHEPLARRSQKSGPLQRLLTRLGERIKGS